MVNGVSTLGLFQSTIDNIKLSQNTLATLQDQISSGLKSRDFEGISARSAEFLSLENEVSRTNKFIENNNINRARLEATTNALSSIIDIGTQLKNDISTRRTGIANIDFQLQLESQFETIANALNATNNGQFIFSGTATDTQAVSPTGFPSLDSEGNLDSYYRGSTQDIFVRSQENISYQINLRADDPAVQKIYEGLALAQEGNLQDNDEQLQRAFDLIDEGIQGVITLQAGVNGRRVALDTTNTQLLDQRIYLDNIKSEIGGTDILAASTQLAVEQGILQATFQAFARINALQLSDFLR